MKFKWSRLIPTYLFDLFLLWVLLYFGMGGWESAVFLTVEFAPLSVIVLAFAAVSYYMPAFSPLIIRLLPSYPMLFAFRETMYDQSNLSYIYTTAGGFAVAAALFFLLSNYRFKRTLTV